MIINRAYKVELKLNDKQRTFFAKSCGCARKAYNWGLDFLIKKYQDDKTYFSAIEMYKELCKIKKTEFSYMYEVSKSAPQNALRNLHQGFLNFFRGLKQKQNVGFPKFKSKKYHKNSFRIDGANIHVNNSTIKLPKIGKIRLKERDYIPVSGVKYLSATISKDVDKWFVSVVVQYKHDIIIKSIEEVIGIDLGVKELATLSNGDVFHNSKNIKKFQNRLRRSQKSLSRRKKGSSNRNRQRIKVAKVHRRIRNCRFDSLHKITSSITKTKCRMVVLEDLNVKGMVKNHKLAKAISDAALGEFKRQCQYKTMFYGGETFLIDRWFPSSKLCSGCGVIKDDLKLSDRIYNCECGLRLDRDLNAAINIRNYFINNQRTASFVGS